MAQAQDDHYDRSRRYQIPTPAMPSPRLSLTFQSEPPTRRASIQDLAPATEQQSSGQEHARQAPIYELPDHESIDYRPSSYISASYIHSDYRPHSQIMTSSSIRDSRHSEYQNPEYLNTTNSRTTQYLRDYQLPEDFHNPNLQKLLPELPAPTLQPVDEQYQESLVSRPSTRASRGYGASRTSYHALSERDDSDYSLDDGTPSKPENGAGDLAAEAVNPKKDFHWKMAFLMICLCQFQIAIDITIIVTALPAIATDLGGTFQQAYWLGTGFVLSSTIMMPLFGMFSEIFGRKVVVQIAVLIFLLASILCATAQSIYWLIATRVIQGVGGGGMLTMASTITTDMTSVRERGKYLGISAIAYAFGMALGNPVGAAVSQYSTWRWVFYINIPISVAIFVGIWFFLRLELETASFRERFFQIDWLGAVVFVGASVALLVGLTSGGVMYPWNHARVIAPIVVGAVLFVVFIFVEIYLAKLPMMPMSLFRNRFAAISYLATFACGLLTLGVGYYLIYFYLGVFQEQLLQSAVDTLPAVVLVSFWALISGGYTAKKGDIRSPLWIGWALEVAAMGAFSSLKPTSTFATSIGVQLLHSAGLGLVYPIVLLACQASQPDSHQGPATAAFMFIRSLGQVFGIAIGGTVFQNVFANGVSRHHEDNSLPQEYVLDKQDAELAFDAIRKMPQAVSDIYRWIYSDSLQAIWYTALAFAALAFLATVFLPKVEMRSTIGSKQKFAHGRKTSSPHLWENKV